MTPARGRRWRAGRWRAGLKARLLILVALAMLPALALVVIRAVEDRHETTAMAYDEIARVVRVAVDQQSQRVDAARDLLLSLSRRPEARSPDAPPCAAMLRALLGALPAYSNVGIASADGRTVCAAVPTNDRGTFADRPWFRQAIATRQIVVAGVPAGRVSGLPLIVVALPLTDEGRVRAVAYAGLRLEWLPQLVRQAQLGRDASVEVIDARGTILTHDPGADRWSAREAPGAPLVRAIVRARQGTTEQPGFDGIRRLHAFAPLGSAGHPTEMYLSVGIPSARAAAGANRTFVRNLLLLAVATALSAALAWSGATALILNTVDALVSAARRLGEGDLSVRVRLSGHEGELTELGQAFDQMADALAERDAALRVAAAERQAGARLRVQSAALEAAANGIVITDAEGTIEWVNPAFTAMTGYGREEAIGRTPRLLKSGQHPPAFYAELWSTVRDGRVWHHEMVNRRKDGTLYDEEQTITPVRDEGGAVVHFVSIKQDVTERRRSAEALRRSEEHFRALIDNARDMIFVLDGHGLVRYASPSVERVTGYRPEELVGQSAFARIHPDDAAAVRAALAVPGFTGSAEYRALRKDGTWQTIEAVGKRIKGEPGLAGIVVNARDITERQRLQGQLAQAEKLAAMGNLLAGVAHELNNPLSIVIGHATLLERAAAGTGLAVRAGKIDAAAKRCARIVKNFLALARQHAPERAPVDLCQLVRETIEMMAYPLRVDDVEVVLDLAEDVPAVSVDSHQIQQVIVNLVTNAHHALREAAEPRRLILAVRGVAAPRAVTLAVSDTGPGIPPDVRARLFEPFFTTKPLGQGTGLGLSICKGVVESHGGRLEVAPAAARGATFTVTLPVEAATAPAAAAEASSPPPPASRLLVVDDEPEVVSILTELLEADGHAVDGAGGGREALARIETAHYDAIVSDLRMPGLDGPALYREVARRHPALARRFLFVTGDTLDPATARFLEETGLPSVSKPFGPDAMRRALARIKEPLAQPATRS